MNPFIKNPSKALRHSVRAETPAPRGEGVVSLRLYDAIDSYGGLWGVSAREFTAALDELPDTTSEIRLLINSPGGEVWEGLAILNALRNHPAKVVAVVEGIAASAASFIAAGVDELQVMENAEIFIHNAWGICIGPAQDMTKMAADLSHEDRNLASIYAAKSGKPVEEWLAAMAAETWYSGDEAVAAGLADGVIAARSTGADAPAAQARARFDLSKLSGRPAAAMNPAPEPPAEPAESTTPNQEGSEMTSDALQSGLRERLGINADADLDEAGLLAALDEALAEHADPSTPPDGTVLIEAGALEQLRADAAQGREARQQQLADGRVADVEAAISDGRIPPARKDHWLAQLEADPGAITVLNGLAAGTIPLEPAGFTGGVEEATDEDAHVFALAGWADDEKKGA